MVPQADKVTLDSADQLVLLERKEMLERMVPLVHLVLQVLRVWLVLGVLLVCPDSVVREVSLVCLDPPVSLESRDPLAALVTADPLDL